MRFSTLAITYKHYSLPSVNSGTILSNPFGWLFPLPWVVYSYGCTNQCSVEYLRGTLCRPPEFSPLQYSSLSLSCPGIPGLTALSPELRESTWLCLYFPFLTCELGNFSRQKSEIITGHISLLPHLSGISCLCCLMWNVLKVIVSYSLSCSLVVSGATVNL